jgi:glycerol-3-phosphate dehydrogenase subunit B
MSRETPSVLVIGDGVAGTAAAWSAARAGATVTVVSAGAGASVLAGGAVDDIPWEDVVSAARITGALPRARALDPGLMAFAEALGLWRLPAEGEPLPLLATLAGRARPAAAHDRTLLDLASIGAGTVAVPRVDRAGWDADSLAAWWSADPSAASRALSFVPIDATVLRYDGENRLSDLDLAARHDDEGRLSWLAERLRKALSRTTVHPVAVILGPWLGFAAPRAAALERALGIRVGEALAGVGGPAGMRFVHARDRLLSLAGVRTIAGRVTDIRLDDDDEGRPSVGMAVHGEETAPIFVDRVVLACGGLAGGGIVYDPLDRHAGADMPQKYGPPFRLSFEVSAREEDEVPCFAARGDRIGVVGSMFGPALDSSAWPAPGRTGLLEHIGVACDPDGLAGPHLAAAGDVVADQPRTALAAVRSGLRAGAWAAAPGG